MMSTSAQLRNYLGVIKKHDFVICLCLIVTVGCSLIVGLRLPKDYVASTLILLIQPASASSASSASVFQSVLSGGLNRGEIDTIKQRFSADSTIKFALQELEETGAMELEHVPALGQLKKNLSAKSLPDTDFIEVSLRIREDKGGARLAAALTNQLVWNLQDMRENEDFSRTEHRRAFLHKKLADLSAEIREQEEKAFDFALDRGSPVVWQAKVANALAEQAELVKAEAEFNRITYAAKNELIRLGNELKNHSEFTKTSETADLDPIWSQYNQRVTALKIDLSGLEAKLGQNSKEVLAHRAHFFNSSLFLSVLNTDI